MKELGQLVAADLVLAVSKPHRTAIALRSVVAYPDRVELDWQILRGEQTAADYWSREIDLATVGGIRIGFSSAPEIVSDFGSVSLGATSADLSFSLAGNMGGGGGWDAGTGQGIGGFQGRWSVRPYPKTGTLVVWWSWEAEGIEPGSTVIDLPDPMPSGSIWE